MQNFLSAAPRVLKYAIFLRFRRFIYISLQWIIFIELIKCYSISHCSCLRGDAWKDWKRSTMSIANARDEFKFGTGRSPVFPFLTLYDWKRPSNLLVRDRTLETPSPYSNFQAWCNKKKSVYNCYHLIKHVLNHI